MRAGGGDAGEGALNPKTETQRLQEKKIPPPLNHRSKTRRQQDGNNGRNGGKNMGRIVRHSSPHAITRCLATNTSVRPRLKQREACDTSTKSTINFPKNKNTVVSTVVPGATREAI